MQGTSQTFGPDELKVLDQIVDAICKELGNGKASKVDTTKLRELISKHVFNHAQQAPLNVAQIKQKVLAVLRSLGNESILTSP
jgi:hypothetical protein